MQKNEMHPPSEEDKFELETGKSPDDTNISLDLDDELPRTEGGDPIEGLHGTDDVDLMAGMQDVRGEIEGIGVEQD